MTAEDNILKVLLTEYTALREELKSKFINQLTIFGIIVSALGVSYSIIFQYNYAKDIVILIPIITISLGLKAQHSNYGVKLLGEYIKALENRIFTYLYSDLKKEDFKLNQMWVGWQHYWNKRQDQSIVNINDALPKHLIYFIIPFGIALIDIYCYGIQNECLRNILNIIGINTNVEFLIMYFIIFMFAFVLYRIFTRENYVNAEDVINDILNNM